MILKQNLRKQNLFNEKKNLQRLLLISASLLLLCGFIQPLVSAGWVAGQEQDSPVRKPAAIVITSSMIDIDGDGQKERVEIRMPSGKRLAEEDLNCSPNYRGFQGKFSMVFQVAGKPVEQNLNSLFEEDEMTFRAERWVVRFADYNHDGRPDFNLGQYENCNGYLYRLFSVAPDGSVTPLKVKGYERGIYVSTFDNSTSQIKVNQTGFSVQSYSNDPNARCPGNCITHFVWKQEKQMFVAERVVPVKE
jgi:hypothetical protein